MKLGPREDELKLATRQSAAYHIALADVDEGVLVRILRIEVGRVVVIVVHRNPDSKEQRNLGHHRFFTYSRTASSWIDYRRLRCRCREIS